jgi:uncharacterized protein (DUF983 family)
VVLASEDERQRTLGREIAAHGIEQHRDRFFQISFLVNAMPFDASGGTSRRPSFRKAFVRGLSRRCPRCGIGPSLVGYVKPATVCEHCGEGLLRFRADDAPAYFTILIVGHLVVPTMLLLERAFHPDTWVYALVAMPLILGLTLGLLPFVKGAWIGVLWSFDVHE